VDLEQQNRRFIRAVGATLGICIAVATILLSLPAGGSGGVLPGTVDVSVRAVGAVGAEPAAPSVVLHAADLRPGNGAASAGFDLIDEAGRAVTVSFEGTPTSTALDSLAWIGISAAGRRLAAGTLGELRQGLGPIVLRSGERRSLRVAVWIPAEVETGYEGRRVGVELAPVATGDGGR
jgi:hypothetical protein